MNIDNYLSINENNCYTYPNGLKQFCNISFIELPIIMSQLGYDEYEYYLSFHSDGGSQLAMSDYATVACAWELFSNKLICLFRKDDKIMSQDVNRICNYRSDDCSSFDIEREIETFRCLEDSIKEGRGIRKDFVARALNCLNAEDASKTKPYGFEFDANGYLISAKYNGYDVRAINDFSIQGIDAYNKYANKFGFIDSDTMKELINYQYECSSHIDSDIILSQISQEKFSYTQDTYCINYIAMAAFYKQCDVELKYFLLSTEGKYEIISKNFTNGVTLTKVKAYNEIFLFINDHLKIEARDTFQSNFRDIWRDGKSGYVYVMINPSIDGMVKIGKTTRDPNERVKELSAATGVPTPFVLVYYKQFSNCHLAEEDIHKLLKNQGYRVNDNREFFRISPTAAIQIIQNYYDEFEKCVVDGQK